MKPKIGTFKFHVESYVCDFKGKLTLPVIGSYLLKAATLHAQERGFGYEDIVKDHTAWVLSRLVVEVSDYPGNDEELTVETWIEDVARYFTQRCFRFVDGQGKVIGHARSIWAAIDMATRRPKDIMSWRPDLAEYILADENCPISKPGKLAGVTGEALLSYPVRYSDIDINGHMNSIKYIEHTIDTFEQEMFRKGSIGSFEIAYLAEGAFGDLLEVYREETAPGEFLVDTKKGEQSICRCKIHWV